MYDRNLSKGNNLKVKNISLLLEDNHFARIRDQRIPDIETGGKRNCHLCWRQAVQAMQVSIIKCASKRNRVI